MVGRHAAPPIMITVALFNNKGGVGKTTLAYHLAWMLARLETRVVAVDLDPQANLTGAFFDAEELESVFDDPKATVFAAVDPIIRGLGDVQLIEAKRLTDHLWVVPGHLGLASFEDRLSTSWSGSLTGDEAALRSTTAFHRIISHIDQSLNPDIVLMDVGPNLGAINRSALLAAQKVVVPVAADLFSVQGLRNLGPALRRWRADWQGTALTRIPGGLDAPSGAMEPVGYVMLQHAMWGGRPTYAYDRWVNRIPQEFRSSVLGKEGLPANPDPYLLASLRHYRSLMPLAQDARKPMFDLRPADGALGSTQKLVQTCYADFETLARKLLEVVKTTPVEGT